MATKYLQVNKFFGMLSLISTWAYTKLIGSIAFLLPLLFAGLSLEYALYGTLAILACSLISWFRVLGYLGLCAGWGYCWYRFAVELYDQVLKPHSVLGYIWIGVVTLLLVWVHLMAMFYSLSLAAGPSTLTEEDEAKPDFEGDRTESKQTSNEFDPYTVLNLEPGSTSAEIREKYRSLMQQYHPDKVQHLGPELKTVARTKTLEIQRAFSELCGNE